MEAQELSRIAGKTAQETWKWANEDSSAPLHELLRDMVALAKGLDPDECTVNLSSGDISEGEVNVCPDCNRLNPGDLASIQPLPGQNWEGTQKFLRLILPEWRMHSICWDEDDQVTAYLADKDGNPKAKGEARTAEAAVLVAVANALAVTLRIRAADAPFRVRRTSATTPFEYGYEP